jgi:hypothetical protein
MPAIAVTKSTASRNWPSVRLSKTTPLSVFWHSGDGCSFFVQRGDYVKSAAGRADYVLSALPAKPIWRHASKTVSATAFDRFKLRLSGRMGMHKQ